MKSKTKISKQVRKKTNPVLVETIIQAQKNDGWKRVAELLSGTRKMMVNLNVSQINSLADEKGTVVVPGKVLSQGNIGKKIKVVALSFSGKAKKKLSDAKIPFSTIIEEIKSNPKGEGIKILKEK